MRLGQDLVFVVVKLDSKSQMAGSSDEEVDLKKEVSVPIVVLILVLDLQMEKKRVH